MSMHSETEERLGVTGDKCPACGAVNNSKVLESRRKASSVVRQRRECEACAARFTTYTISSKDYQYLLESLAQQKDGAIRQLRDLAKKLLKLADETEKIMIGDDE